ncbi:eCIS core domain-containing protein [Halomonas maura]|uniref:eCIS core domain-containing protein n=1 Tax=Halomonas maura TaxID=117606 RepID=UPI0025B2BAC7|nr:DUF4157 domain-containing protein [Halomonas maura]MDN3556273.1 DUF4157 domain-containing protein [Halomonas maura]
MAGTLSPSRRAQLEAEADTLADRFMNYRSAMAPRSPLDAPGFHRPSQAATVGSMPKTAVPDIRQSSPPSDTMLFKEDEEEANSQGGTPAEPKGIDSIEETAETQVGEPSSERSPEEQEAVLTKRIDNRGRPATLPPATAGSGRPLPTSYRQEMEAFFGRDFSGVRIHNDGASHQYTQHLGALAAASRHHIYLSNRIPAGQFPHLLAHELTHVVQQNRAPRLDRQPAGVDITGQAPTHPVLLQKPSPGLPPAISSAPEGVQCYQDTICRGKRSEHDSTQPYDFPDTYISQVNVSLTDQRVTLDWTGPNVAEAERIVRRVTGDGIINCSTGAGVRGETSCNDTGHSTRSGSCCTPIGSFTLGGQSCVTPKLKLQNFSGFQRAGIGLHYYSEVPRHPASHGCVRLHWGASKIIFDSARPGHTTVAVSGRYAGSYRRYRSCS